MSSVVSTTRRHSGCRQCLPPWATSLFLPLSRWWRVTDLTWHYVMLQFNITVGGTPHILYCRIVVGHRYYITLCDVTSYILYNITPHITIDDKNENVCRVTDGLGRDWFAGTMNHYITSLHIVITYHYILLHYKLQVGHGWSFSIATTAAETLKGVNKSGSSAALPAVNGNGIDWSFVIGGRL